MRQGTDLHAQLHGPFGRSPPGHGEGPAFRRSADRVAIEIHTASYRSTRGYTIIAALLDEISIWESDEFAAEPDVEVINAILTQKRNRLGG